MKWWVRRIFGRIDVTAIMLYWLIVGIYVLYCSIIKKKKVHMYYIVYQIFIVFNVHTVQYVFIVYICMYYTTELCF